MFDGNFAWNTSCWNKRNVPSTKRWWKQKNIYNWKEEILKLEQKDMCLQKKSIVEGFVKKLIVFYSLNKIMKQCLNHIFFFYHLNQNNLHFEKFLISSLVDCSNNTFWNSHFLCIARTYSSFLHTKKTKKNNKGIVFRKFFFVLPFFRIWWNKKLLFSWIDCANENKL